MVSFRRMTDISHIVALSPEGQVAIPKDILEALGLQEGAKLEVALEGHRVVMRTVSEEYPDWRTRCKERLDRLTNPLPKS